MSSGDPQEGECFSQGVKSVDSFADVSKFTVKGGLTPNLRNCLWAWKLSTLTEDCPVTGGHLALIYNNSLHKLGLTEVTENSTDLTATALILPNQHLLSHSDCQALISLNNIIGYIRYFSAFSILNSFNAGPPQSTKRKIYQEPFACYLEGHGT